MCGSRILLSFFLLCYAFPTGVSAFSAARLKLRPMKARVPMKRVHANQNDKEEAIHVDAAAIDSVSKADKPDSEEGGGGGSAAVALVALTAAFTAIQWGRSAIYYLVDFAQVSGDPFVFVNSDLGFDASSYGLISTLAFAAPFTLSSLASGFLVDKAPHRGRLVALSAAGVGLTLVAQAASHSALEYGAARAVQGLCSGVLAPAAYALLAEYYPQERLAVANSRFTGGIFLGGALASLSAVLDERVGWRATTLSLAAFSAVAATAVLFLVPDPAATAASASSSSSSSSSDAATSADLSSNDNAKSRSGSSNAVTIIVEPLKVAAKAILGDKTLRLVFVGSMVRFSAGFTILAWLAPWARQAFPNDVDSFALYNAAIKCGGGFAATLIGAAACDALRESNAALPWPVTTSSPSSSANTTTAWFSLGGPRADAVVPAVGSFLAALFWVALLTPPPAMANTPQAQVAAMAASSGSLELGSFGATMGLLLLAYLAAENWLGPTVALLQRGVPAQSRGAALGLFGAATQIVGNTAPAIVGTLTGPTFQMPLRDAFLGVVVSSYVLSACFFAAVAASIDVETNDRDGTNGSDGS